MALIKGFHPDSPLAKGGVLITGRARRIDSSPTPSTRTTDPNADPMQGAVDQIERALKAKDDRAVAEAKARATGKPSTDTASPSPEFTTPESNDRS